MYVLNWHGISFTAVADTTAFTDNGYAFFLQGGNSTMQLKINEIYIGGEATSASTVVTAKFARDSTVGATSIGAGTLRNAVTDATNTAPGTVAVFGQVSTTKPQRSSTLHLASLSFNAFGGVTRMQCRPGEEFSTIGASASLGEVSLSAFTGSGVGPCSGYVKYELV
jgi:hypothetical protein